MGYKTHRFARKTHRYFGVFIGIQFFLWTLGGLYFSWNNMDDVHGETLLDKTEHTFSFQYNEPVRKLLRALQEVDPQPIFSIEGIVVAQDSLLRITRADDVKLINLTQNRLQEKLTEAECITFVKDRLYEELSILDTRIITKKEVAKGHEYRGKPLPAYAFSIDHPTNTIVYVHPELAKITTVRNDNWRRFDFLWMLHVMDFETRDHITNWVLRVFSVLGILTILSGFYLFYLSSPTIRKLKRKI